MNRTDTTGHEEACKKAGPDDICTNCGAYELGLVRDVCCLCKPKLFGRELSTEEERTLANSALEAFTTAHPSPIVDESVPRLEPYVPRETPSIPWSRHLWLRIEVSTTFPWLTITRY